MPRTVKTPSRVTISVHLQDFLYLDALAKSAGKKPVSMAYVINNIVTWYREAIAAEKAENEKKSELQSQPVTQHDSNSQPVKRIIIKGGN